VQLQGTAALCEAVEQKTWALYCYVTCIPHGSKQIPISSFSWTPTTAADNSFGVTHFCISFSAYPNRCHAMLSTKFALHPLSFHILLWFALQACQCSSHWYSIKTRQPDQIVYPKRRHCQNHSTSQKVVCYVMSAILTRCGQVRILVACRLLQQGPTLHACLLRLLPIGALDSGTCLLDTTHNLIYSALSTQYTQMLCLCFKWHMASTATWVKICAHARFACSKFDHLQRPLPLFHQSTYHHKFFESSFQ
jgi:hypothetical protein